MIKKLWDAFWRPSATLPLGVLLIVGGVAGILFIGTFHFGLAGTNKTEFCVSCHEMEWAYEEYKESPHYSNPSGVRAGCADCHVPHDKTFGGWVDKMIAKMKAAKDTYHHILGTYDTKEKYEAGRWEMANAVWEKMRARDSKECRYCHDFEAMDMSAQDRSAAKKHKRAQEEGKTCIDCHTGIAHEEPEPPEEEEPKEETTASTSTGS